MDKSRFLRFSDDLFAKHGQELSPLKEWLYRHIGRRLMNRNVSKIRG